ncbi:MAG: pre-peptidase C-terminal domain-containing protein [Thermoleophilia bacterium]
MTTVALGRTAPFPLCRSLSRRRRARSLWAVVDTILMLCAVALVPAEASATTADSFEPDGTYSSASTIGTSGIPQQHTIFPSQDEDWMSFTVDAGSIYAIETAQNTSSDTLDTVLELYDSNGTTLLASNDDNEGSSPYSRIDYTASASKTLYARVTGFAATSIGGYAFTVRALGATGTISVPGTADFGNVPAGSTQRRTIQVKNAGSAPLTITGVEISGSAFSIVRDEANGATIPAGGTREIEVKYAPTVGYGGAPNAVAHSWTNVLVQYNYDVDTGVLASRTVFAGFLNTGGAGDLAWRVRAPSSERSGTSAVVAGGGYSIRVTVNDGRGTGLVELLKPVTKTWNFDRTLGSLASVTVSRVPDGRLTITSNDAENPQKIVGLFGVCPKTQSRASCKITLTLSGLTKGALKLGNKVTAKGKVTSTNLSATKAKLTLQRKAGSTWAKVKVVSRTLSAAKTYSWTYKPTRKGTYRIRATVAQTATNKSAASSWKTFSVK